MSTHVFRLNHVLHIFTPRMCWRSDHKGTEYWDPFSPSQLFFIWQGGNPRGRGCVNALKDVCECVFMSVCVCVAFRGSCCLSACVHVGVWEAVRAVFPLSCPHYTQSSHWWAQWALATTTSNPDISSLTWNTCMECKWKLPSWAEVLTEHI